MGDQAALQLAARRFRALPPASRTLVIVFAVPLAASCLFVLPLSGPRTALRDLPAPVQQQIERAAPSQERRAHDTAEAADPAPHDPPHAAWPWHGAPAPLSALANSCPAQRLLPGAGTAPWAPAGLDSPRHEFLLSSTRSERGPPSRVPA